MPLITTQLQHAFAAAIKEAFDIDADPQIGVSQNDSFGDYQSNVAMGLVKRLGEQAGKRPSPRAVAEQIKAKLNIGSMADISIAGPGFINIKLLPAWLSDRLNSITHDSRLGIEPIQNPVTVVVDYSGPNIAKEMHVGHLRSTIIGDAVSRVLAFQANELYKGTWSYVIRQNHIGDWGTQFGMLIHHLRSTFLDIKGIPRAGMVRPSGDPFAIPKIVDLEEFYREAKVHFEDEDEPTFAEESRRAVVKLQSGSSEELLLWKQIVEATREHYQPLYKNLGVKLTQADERGESAYNNSLRSVVEDLTKSGVAVESEGAVVVRVPGYESPLIIRKTDGGYLYGTTDLAAVRYRINDLHAKRIIYVHDSRQQQHFNQVFWTARQASWTRGDDVQLEYAPFGTMLGEDGKPFKTRSGGTIKLRQLLDEAKDRAIKVVIEKNPELPASQQEQIAHSVGIGGVKYSDLAKDRISDYTFSFDKMLSLDGNTAPYLQYAHARIRSIFRKSADAKPGTITLESPFEIALAKHILRLGEVIELVARELKPHHLCTYLYDLATRFSGFYENCPVLQSQDPIRASRLALCDLTARTMAVGLDLLGIEHPDQM